MPWLDVLSEAGNAPMRPCGAISPRSPTPVRRAIVWIPSAGFGWVVRSSPAPATKDARSGYAASEHGCRHDGRNAMTKDEQRVVKLQLEIAVGGTGICSS